MLAEPRGTVTGRRWDIRSLVVGCPGDHWRMRGGVRLEELFGQDLLALFAALDGERI